MAIASPISPTQSNHNQPITKTAMKLFARIGAILSFSSFFIAGVSLISLTRSHPNSDATPVVALGLCLVGAAFFAGTMLWLASEKARSPGDHH